MFIIPPKYEFATFNNEDHKIGKLKDWGLVAKTTKNPKTNFKYKSIDKKEYECSIVGFESDICIVIQVQDSLTCIHPMLLKDMQKKDFSYIGNKGDGDSECN